jgi:ribosomal 50S subunit-recycling heat shock protein
MKKEENFEPASMGLPHSSEFDETAALLAYGATERKPPAHVKARLMASLRSKPERSGNSLRWIIAAGAIATLLLVPRFFSARAQSEFLVVRGAVTVDGHVVSAGERLALGQTISVPADGEAVVRIGKRAGFRLTHGAQAQIARDDSSVEIRLRKGWILSAVKTGTPYTVVTDHGRTSALGTDFIVKTEDGWAWACICHGRLGLSGFPQETIAAEHHAHILQPLFPSQKAEPRKGHTDEDIASLRALLHFDSSK